MHLPGSFVGNLIPKATKLRGGALKRCFAGLAPLQRCVRCHRVNASWKDDSDPLPCLPCLRYCAFSSTKWIKAHLFSAPDHPFSPAVPLFMVLFCLTSSLQSPTCVFWKAQFKVHGIRECLVPFVVMMPLLWSAIKTPTCLVCVPAVDACFFSLVIYLPTPSPPSLTNYKLMQMRDQVSSLVLLNTQHVISWILQTYWAENTLRWWNTACIFHPRGLLTPGCTYDMRGHKSKIKWNMVPVILKSTYSAL